MLDVVVLAKVVLVGSLTAATVMVLAAWKAPRPWRRGVCWSWAIGAGVLGASGATDQWPSWPALEDRARFLTLVVPLTLMVETLATTVRSMIMAGFLILVSLGLGKFNAQMLSEIKMKDWIFITLAGVAGAMSWLFYFFALKNGNAGAVSAIDRTSIIFVVVFAAIFLGEAFTWKVGSGAVLVALGVYLVAVK